MKGELPGGQGAHPFSGERGQIPLQPLALPFVGADQYHRPPQGLAQPGGKVGAMNGGQAVHRRRTGAVVHGGAQLPEFREIVERGKQRRSAHSATDGGRPVRPPAPQQDGAKAIQQQDQRRRDQNQPRQVDRQQAPA